MSNRELPMMPWYPDQFAASTVAWTWLERSLYRCLLDVQWQLGSLPADPKRISLCAGFPEAEFDVAWNIVSGKFTKAGGKLINKRLEYHRLAALKRKEKAASSGSSGGKASAVANAKRRSSKPRATLQANANPPSPSPSPEVREDPLTPAARGTNGASAPSRKGPDRLRRDVSREAWSGSTGRIDQVRATAKLPSDQRLTWAYVQEHVDPIAWEAIQQIGGCNVIADRDRYTEENLKQRFREAYEQRSAPA